MSEGKKYTDYLNEEEDKCHEAYGESGFFNQIALYSCLQGAPGRAKEKWQLDNPDQSSSTTESSRGPMYAAIAVVAIVVIAYLYFRFKKK